DQWRSVGGHGRWGHRKNHEDWIPAGESHHTVLRECGPSPRSFALGHASPNCIFVPQINQAAAKNDAGAEAETNECGAVTELNPVNFAEWSRRKKPRMRTAVAALNLD